MKKTIPTTLSGILFYIEEDAFARLSNYLDSVKKYFDANPSKAEIIADIESRISEQFLENSKKEKIITLQNVEDVISSMGTTEDFSSADNPGNESSEKISESASLEEKNKKLFRNPDDIVIAGVASGIGAYFGVDAVIIRLLFVLVVFLGGSGVLLYIVLWLIMPLAKTSADKLQMRGEAVTLESVSETVREKVNEVKHKGKLRKLISYPIFLLSALFRFILPLIQKIIGLVVSLATSIAMFALIFALFATIFNMDSPYVDFPILQIGHHAAIYTMLVAGFVAIFVPLFFLFSLGIKLLSRKSILNSKATFSLVGVWFIAILTFGTNATRIIPEYKHFMDTNPAFQDVTREFELKDFDGLKIKNNVEVTVIEGDEFRVAVTGWEDKIKNITLEVAEGDLVVGMQSPFKICIFCFGRSAKVEVTLPKITRIDASNSSTVISPLLAGDSLSLRLSNSSSAILVLNIKTLELNQKNSSWARLTGTTTVSTINLSNSSALNAYGLSSEDVTISAENSSDANIFAKKKLNATLKNSSYVEYSGNPTVTEKVSNSSVLRKEEYETLDF